MREQILESFYSGNFRYSVHRKYSSNGARNRTTDETRRGQPMHKLRTFLSRVEMDQAPKRVTEVRLNLEDERSFDAVQAVKYPSPKEWAEAQAAWAEAIIASKPRKRVFTIPKGQAVEQAIQAEESSLATNRAGRFVE